MPQKPPVPAREAIPVARPAGLIPAAEVETPAASWLSAESLKGLASSVVLHALLLLAMGLWYFTPSSNPERTFDTRLAGSEMGVEEGLTATGGLNTPLDLTTSTEPPAEPALSALAPLDVDAVGQKFARLPGAEKSSAGGGVENPNPGAGNNDGFGLARFGQGGESIRGVAVKVGDPQFTLLWDSEADLDLHVIEPGGKEIYWEEPKGAFGGELDVDNTKGYGPENVYWLRDGGEKGERLIGAGPPGEYRWFVVYWGGFGGVPRPTRWKVRIKHNGKVTIATGRFKALNERSKTHTLKVDAPSAADEATAR